MQHSDEDLDKMVSRHYRRMQTFVNQGLPEGESFDLAEAMWERDLDPQDDRRVCFECQHLAVKYCSAILDRQSRPIQPLRFILQRCNKFQLKGKS